MDVLSVPAMSTTTLISRFPQVPEPGFYLNLFSTFRNLLRHALFFERRLHRERFAVREFRCDPAVAAEGNVDPYVHVRDVRAQNWRSDGHRGSTDADDIQNRVGLSDRLGCRGPGHHRVASSFIGGIVCRVANHVQPHELKRRRKNQEEHRRDDGKFDDDRCAAV